jgi:alkylation response protein AidB-like acyl-CoA dehydrogenase
MEFGWSPEQNDLYDRVLRFSREKLNDDVAARERKAAFSFEAWRRCGDLGLLGLCVPEADGGMGLGSLSTARAMEAFGRGCEDTGLTFAVSAHLFACVAPLALFGSDEQKARWLPGLIDGRTIAANAITEAGAGSDVFSLKTRAERRGDDYVLSGEKSYVTNGPVADVFVVYAVTNPTHGYFGISAFVVPKDAPGLTVGAPFEKVGLVTAQTSSVYFDNCVVSAKHLLAAEGQGALVFEQSMGWERACLFACYLGVLDRQLERCVAYASERKQFGKPIGDNQAIAHRVADMKQRLEAARLLLYRACWLRDQGHDALMDISLAKLAVSEAAVKSGLDAIQIHGGNGVIVDYGIERMLRDALPSTIFSGTSEMQRSIIARELGL